MPAKSVTRRASRKAPAKQNPANLQKLERAVDKAHASARAAVLNLLRAKGDMHPAFDAGGNISHDEALERSARIREREFMQRVVKTKTGGVPRNYLVEEGDRIGTVRNVRSVLDFLLITTLQDATTSEEAESGRFLLMNLLSDALTYVEAEDDAERWYKQRKEEREAKKGGAA